MLHDGGEFYLRTIYIQQLAYTIEMLTKKQPLYGLRKYEFCQRSE